MSDLSFEGSKYLHKTNNYILPRIIISIATEDFHDDKKENINHYGYSNIILKSKSGLNKNSLSEDAKTVLGLICHEMLTKKKFEIDLNYFDIMKALNVNEKTLLKNKNLHIGNLKKLIEEINDVSINFKFKGSSIAINGFLSAVAYAEKDAGDYDFINQNTVRFYINERFLDLFKHDGYFVAGDSNKINSEKGEKANILYKVLIANNFKPFKENTVYLNSVFYTLQLKSKDNKDKIRSLKNILNGLVSSGKLKSYEFGKVGFEKTLNFTLNKFDITGGEKKTTLNAVKKDDTYSYEGEYETFESEPENAKIVNDKSDELPEGHEKIFTNSFDVEEEDDFPF